MRNKLKLVDFNILSSYMGRFLTLIVMVLVFAITMSALLSEGGLREQRVFEMCIPSGTVERYSPLRELLANVMSRTMILQECDNKCEHRCELRVMDVAEFLVERERFGAGQAFALNRAERGTDRAVLISTGDESSPTPGSIVPSDIARGRERSLNTYWLQLSALHQDGTLHADPFVADAALGAAVPGDATRAIYAVVHGRYRYGACRSSDLDALFHSGGLQPAEVVVVREVLAVPEMILAVRGRHVPYLERSIKAVAVIIAANESQGRHADTVRRLKSGGIRQISPARDEQLNRAAELLSRVGDRF